MLAVNSQSRHAEDRALPTTTWLVLIGWGVMALGVIFLLGVNGSLGIGIMGAGALTITGGLGGDLLREIHFHYINDIQGKKLLEKVNSQMDAFNNNEL